MQSQTVVCRSVHVFNKELESPFTLRLGGVQSGIGISQQVARIDGCAAGQGDAHAGADHNLGGSEREWFA